MNSLKLMFLIIMVATGVTCLAQQLSDSLSGANIDNISAGVNKVTADKIVNAKLPTLLELGSKKCVPCKMMAPILTKLGDEYAGILKIEFIDVWVKENVKVAEKYKISTIPTQIFLNAEGKELWRHSGYISEEDILKQWKTLGYDFKKMKSQNNK